MKTAYIAKQRQISFVKSHFSRQLEEKLGLIEVQAMGPRITSLVAKKRFRLK